MRQGGGGPLGFGSKLDFVGKFLQIRPRKPLLFNKICWCRAHSSLERERKSSEPGEFGHTKKVC